MVRHVHPVRRVHHGGQAVTAARRKSESWDDFVRSQFGARTEKICGVTVPVPSDIPLAFEELASGLSAESEESDFVQVVALLFGEGVFEQWKRAGIGVMGLMTVLTWGVAQAHGRDMTFSEAYEVVTSDDPGKALNPPPNRAARRQRSAPTGGPSKPTSRASTASTRKTSR
ncbi:hypothetical protein ACIPJK_23855 [Streptomyces roseus]|uniref:hypothetical protein n=1 Tax=Streptomyces roseus TaxID=66430 RepID=UPI0038226CC6